MEIVSIPIIFGALAAYNPEKDIIVYYQGLEQYPELLENVLKHEKQHAIDLQKKIWIHKVIWQEIHDYTITAFNNDYQEFKTQEEEKDKYPIQRTLYQILMVPVQLWFGVCIFAGWIAWKIKRKHT